MHIYCSSFMHPVDPFRIFTKILWDIRKNRLNTGVNDTGDKWKIFWDRTLFYIFLYAVEIDENPGKGLITGVNDTGNNLSPVTQTRQ
jgi:hypothetical protein